MPKRRRSSSPSSPPSKPRTRRAVVGTAAVGRGAFAGRDIERGDVIGQVRGQLTDDSAVDPYYCMEMDNGLFLVPKAPFRYLNHCCTPNARLFMWDEDPIDPVTNTRPLYVEALRRIRAGTELTIDYAWPAHLSIACLCKSRRCRGFIVDQAELTHARRLHRRSKAS